jgi:uncharacterized protein YcbK (DUF882 family)
VTSAFRPKNFNDKIGGSKQSTHQSGNSFDIRLIGYSNIFNILKEFDRE